MAAFQHLAASQGEDPKKAVAAVAVRCQALLAAMSPLPDDLKALAADPWTEQDDRWYFVTTAQHYGVVSFRRGLESFISVCVPKYIGHRTKSGKLTAAELEQLSRLFLK